MGGRAAQAPRDRRSGNDCGEDGEGESGCAAAPAASRAADAGRGYEAESSEA
jgi:hypothetical protein